MQHPNLMSRATMFKYGCPWQVLMVSLLILFRRHPCEVFGGLRSLRCSSLIQHEAVTADFALG